MKDIPSNISSSNASALLAELKSSQWIDGSTAIVFVSFTVFNPSTNAFVYSEYECVSCRIVSPVNSTIALLLLIVDLNKQSHLPRIEFLPGGLLSTSSSHRVFADPGSSGAADPVNAFLRYAFMILTAYYLYSCGVALYEIGRKRAESAKSKTQLETAYHKLFVPNTDFSFRRPSLDLSNVSKNEGCEWFL